MKHLDDDTKHLDKSIFIAWAAIIIVAAMIALAIFFGASPGAHDKPAAERHAAVQSWRPYIRDVRRGYPDLAPSTTDAELISAYGSMCSWAGRNEEKATEAILPKDETAETRLIQKLLDVYCNPYNPGYLGP